MQRKLVRSPLFDAAVLRDLFQANVRALLLRERFISTELVERMMDRAAFRPAETPRAVAAAVGQFPPRPVPKDLRTAVERPEAGLSPSTPSVSTSDVCMDF